jgi:phosphate transport system permease protein
VLFTPELGLAGLSSTGTSLPNQIYNLTSQSREEFRVAASAAIIVLLVMILGMNAVAIFIRNKFQRSW